MTMAETREKPEKKDKKAAKPPKGAPEAAAAPAAPAEPAPPARLRDHYQQRVRRRRDKDGTIERIAVKSGQPIPRVK